MSKSRILVIIAACIAFIGILLYSSLRTSRRVEVCITFQGRTACRIASAETEQEAIRTATETACAVLASGVTDTMACLRTPPDRVRVLD